MDGRKLRRREMLKKMTHQKISFWKSGLRFVGYFLLPFDMVLACIVLVISEVLGIVEEVGEWQTPTK